MRFTRALALAAVIAAVIISVSPVMATIIPADRNYVVSLDGDWRFKIEHLDNDYKEMEFMRHNSKPDSAIDFEHFYLPSYQEDGKWVDLKVPGNWEMAGLSAATYNQPDETSGFYRKEFEVPASWKGRIVKLNFDGVQNGAEIWLNGRPVNVSEPSWGRANYHESGWTAWQADLTPAVKFGEKNLLAMRVTKSTKSANSDTGDYFFLGGIDRTVTLFSVPQSRIEDITVRTKLLDGGKAEVKTIVNVAGEGDSSVVMQIKDIGSMEQKCTGGKVEFVKVVDNPKLWSAEHPNLYPMTLVLKNSRGKVIETATRKIGIREITIKNGVFMVNGVPVKMLGICRHDVYPTEGTALTDDVWIKDLQMMKAANFNAIRTSHYPYGSKFYDLCDEMGFYVLGELSMCWTNMNDASLTPAYLQRTREEVARDKNHPCIVVWGIGNENNDGVNQKIVADALKELDPTRPRLNSCKDGSESDVEMDDRHYPAPAKMRQQAEDKTKRDKWTAMYSENPNVWDVRFGADYGALDAWTPVYQRTIDVVREYDGICGNFLWEWTDRAVADKFPVKLYQYEKATGMNYLKTKGIVDGWRTPRPEYYNIKMINSPVAVEREADLTSKPGTAILNVANRYSFTNLSEINANWSILKNGKVLKNGTTHFDMAPSKSGRVELPLSAAGDTLQVSFDHPGGWNVATYQFPLVKNGAEGIMNASLPEGLSFPSLNFIGRDTVKDDKAWRKVTRFPGKLINTKVNPEGDGKMADVKSIEGDLVLDNDLNTIVGHVNVEFSNGEFKYRLEWSGKKMDLQEMGWVFEMPKAYDRFSWNKQSLWSYYPDTHIGRAVGTALPDTMNDHLTKLIRPNAFDFNSTKYDCNWASLTNASGHGLCIGFPSEDRHQVRGGVAADGGYTLTINKFCCPPRDISSGVVEDLYVTLEKGKAIEGSFRVGSR